MSLVVFCLFRFLPYYDKCFLFFFLHSNHMMRLGLLNTLFNFGMIHWRTLFFTWWYLEDPIDEVGPHLRIEWLVMWWTYSHQIMLKRDTVNWLAKSSNMRNIETSFSSSRLRLYFNSKVKTNNFLQNYMYYDLGLFKPVFFCSYDLAVPNVIL